MSIVRVPVLRLMINVNNSSIFRLIPIITNILLVAAQGPPDGNSSTSIWWIVVSFCANIHGHQMMNPTDFRPHWITTHLCLRNGRPPQAFQAFFSAIIFLQEQNRFLPEIRSQRSSARCVQTPIRPLCCIHRNSICKSAVSPLWRMVKITCGPMCVEKLDQNNHKKTCSEIVNIQDKMYPKLPLNMKLCNIIIINTRNCSHFVSGCMLPEFKKIQLPYFLY